MLCAKRINDRVIFQTNEESDLATYSELMDYVCEGCEKTLIGMIMVKEGIVLINEEQFELLVRFI